MILSPVLMLAEPCIQMDSKPNAVAVNRKRTNNPYPRCAWKGGDSCGRRHWFMKISKREINEIVRYVLNQQGNCGHDALSDCPRCMSRWIREAIRAVRKKQEQHWFMSKSTEIHDMIQTFPLDATESPELTASRILDILDAMNRRMDEMESAQRQSPMSHSGISSSL